MSPQNDEFYLRFYNEKKGENGVDFLEVEFDGNSQLKYAYSSRKRDANICRGGAFVSDKTTSQLKRLIRESGVTKFPAGDFPSSTPDCHQELEISLNGNSVLLSPKPVKESTTGDKENNGRPETEKEKNIAHNFNTITKDVKCLFFSLVFLSDYKMETF